MELLNCLCLELNLTLPTKDENNEFRIFLKEVCLLKTPNSLFSTNAFKSSSANDILELLKIIINYDFICEWFVKSENNLGKCDRSIDDEDAIHNLTEIVYSNSTIPQLPEDARFNESNYIKLNQCAKLGLEIFLHLVEFINTKDGIEEEHKYIISIFSLLLCFEHSRKHPWSDEVSIILSKKIQDFLFKSISLSDLVMKKSVVRLNAFFFTDMLKYITPKLHSSNWKQNPAAMFVFLRLLENLKGSINCDLILPPILSLLDDFEDENIIMGLDSLNYFLKISSKFELKQFNRVEVIFESLMNQLHTKNDLVLVKVLTNLFLILQITSSKSRDFGKEERCDRALIEILKRMQIENQMNLRRTYCLHLAGFIEISNLASLKYSKFMLEVMLSYLECFDDGEEGCRVNILLSLQHLMKVTWPRIHLRALDVVKSLVRLLHELSSSSYPGKDAARQRLVSSAGTCLRILNQLVPEIGRSIDSVLLLNLEDSFRNNLQEVLIKNDI